MDFGILVKMVADLFLVYTFGDIWLGGIFVMLIFNYIGWKMQLSADGWVVNLAGQGLLFGAFYFNTLGLLPIVLICMAFLAYFLLKRVMRGY
jgi:hypothetical protein